MPRVVAACMARLASLVRDGPDAGLVAYNIPAPPARQCSGRAARCQLTRCGETALRYWTDARLSSPGGSRARRALHRRGRTQRIDGPFGQSLPVVDYFG